MYEIIIESPLKTSTYNFTLSQRDTSKKEKRTRVADLDFYDVPLSASFAISISLRCIHFPTFFVSKHLQFMFFPPEEEKQNKQVILNREMQWIVF
jgi:hypothetical protein